MVSVGGLRNIFTNLLNKRIPEEVKNVKDIEYKINEVAGILDSENRSIIINIERLVAEETKGIYDIRATITEAKSVHNKLVNAANTLKRLGEDLHAINSGHLDLEISWPAYQDRGRKHELLGKLSKLKGELHTFVQMELNPAKKQLADISQKIKDLDIREKDKTRLRNILVRRAGEAHDHLSTVQTQMLAQLKNLETRLGGL